MKAATIATGSLLALALAVGADSHAATESHEGSSNPSLQPASAHQYRPGPQTMFEHSANGPTSYSSVWLDRGLPDPDVPG